MKLVSCAPRSSRLNSSSFPRLRSQPIQLPSPAIPLPAAVKQMKAMRLFVAVAIVEFCDSGFGSFKQ